MTLSSVLIFAKYSKKNQSVKDTQWRLISVHFDSLFFFFASERRKSIKPKREKNLRIELIVVGEGHGIETVVEFFVKLKAQVTILIISGIIIELFAKVKCDRGKLDQSIAQHWHIIEVNKRIIDKKILNWKKVYTIKTITILRFYFICVEHSEWLTKKYSRKKLNFHKNCNSEVDFSSVSNPWQLGPSAEEIWRKKCERSDET